MMIAAKVEKLREVALCSTLGGPQVPLCSFSFTHIMAHLKNRPVLLLEGLIDAVSLARIE